MTTHRMPVAVCPACKTPLNAATNVENDAPPRHGDLTICAGCTTYLRFERVAIFTGSYK